MLQFSACTPDLPCKSLGLLVTYTRAPHSCGAKWLFQQGRQELCCTRCSSGPLLAELVLMLWRGAATTKLPCCLPSLCAAWPSHCLHRETQRSFPRKRHQHHGSVSGEQWDQCGSPWVDLQLLSSQAVSLWEQTGKDVWWTLKYFKVLFKTVAPSLMLFQFILHAEEGKNSEKNDVGSCIK